MSNLRKNYTYKDNRNQINKMRIWKNASKIVSGKKSY